MALGTGLLRKVVLFLPCSLLLEDHHSCIPDMHIVDQEWWNRRYSRGWWTVVHIVDQRCTLLSRSAHLRVPGINNPGTES